LNSATNVIRTSSSKTEHFRASLEAKSWLQCLPVGGNSLAVRILQTLAKEIDLIEGSEVELILMDGNLVIKPITRRQYSLEVVQAITPENLHGEIDSGSALGNEVW
jgi:antitoxin MazE